MAHFSVTNALLASLLACSALAVPTSTLKSRATGTGCGASHTHHKGYNTNGGNGFSVQSGGKTRTYTINVPQNYDPTQAMGVILSYHGNHGTSDGQASLTNFGNETWNPNLLSVFPQGVDNSWEGPGYADNSVDDVQFTLDLLDHLRENYCIDDSRIYASGKSNGGGFVGTLACSRASAQIAAFSACSGAFYTDNDQNYTQCAPARSNIPMLEFHGGADGTISYNGATRSAGTVPPIPHWLARWGTRNQCAGSTNTFSFNNQVNHTVYSCPENTAVEAYWIQHMDHSWPSTTPNSDNKAHGDGPTVLDATPLIVDFYNRFTLPASS